MDLARETEALAALVNAPRDHFDPDEQALLDEDLKKARAAVEVAWLERGVGGQTNAPSAEGPMGAGPLCAGTLRPDVEPIETIGVTTDQPDGW